MPLAGRNFQRNAFPLSTSLHRQDQEANETINDYLGTWPNSNRLEAKKALLDSLKRVARFLQLYSSSGQRLTHERGRQRVSLISATPLQGRCWDVFKQRQMQKVRDEIRLLLLKYR